ncbi:unnamed protein product, partial [Vitis vinifera]
MAFNMTSIKTSSDGAWQGDNPLRFAFPLLIVQTTLVLSISRFLAFLLKPFHQPRVIAEIIGGILLGPSALGRNKDFLHLVFPPWSTPILESVASVGLLFFLFLVGLELDLSSIRRSGKRAFGIALAGISLPFIFGVGITFLLRKAVDGEDKVGFSQCILFIGVSLSITAFPVLARILAELKLLTTDVGQTAMAAAAFNDVAAWILLAPAVALAGNGGSHSSPLASIWILISGVAFVAFMLTIIRPAMNWVGRQCSRKHDSMDEAYICLTLAGVMLSGFTTDLIGIHAIFGGFVFGLTIPKGGEFAQRLIKRIEDFVTGLLLPLYFASSGLKTDVAKIQGVKAWGLLVLVISTACAGKVLGTFVVAMLCMTPVRESLVLGVLMNTKGLVELIVLNIGKEKKVLNDEVFAILVLMALFTTFMTTPAVMAIYKPIRRIATQAQPQIQRESNVAENSSQDKLRILACVHGPANVPSLISLIDSTCNANKSPLKLYVMHLMELTDRTSSILMVQRGRKNGFPFIKGFRRGEVTVRPTKAISALSTMHEDICHAAKKKRVGMIVLSFHKQWRGEGEEAVENVGHEWRGVNQRVLKNAPCPVGVLVDRGFGGVERRVCILFLGGPDDRYALKLGGSMAEHSAVRVTLVRLVEKGKIDSNSISSQGLAQDGCIDVCCASSTTPIYCGKEKELDEATVAEFRSRWEGSAKHVEKEVEATNVLEEVLLAIGRCREYELIVVGKGGFPPNMVAIAQLSDHQPEHAELGPIGDVLASSGRGITASVLVIQHHSLPHEHHQPLLMPIHDHMDDTITAEEPTV